MLDVSVIEEAPEGNSFLFGQATRLFCNVCNTSFKNSTTLKHHVKNVCQKTAKDKNLKCARCSKAFNTVTGYQYHLKHQVCDREVSSIVPKCPHCYKMFTTPSGLTYHLKKQVCTQMQPHDSGENEIVPCTNCHATFTNRASMVYHATHNVCLLSPKATPKRKNLLCPVCNGSFKSTIILSHHLKNSECSQRELVQNIAKPQCRKCKKRFSVAGLEYHKKHKVCTAGRITLPTHRKKPVLPHCGKCNKVFRGAPGLEYHLKKNVCDQKATAPPFECEVCGKNFESKQSWYAHVKRQSCQDIPELFLMDGQVEPVVKLEVDSI